MFPGLYRLGPTKARFHEGISELAESLPTRVVAPHVAVEVVPSVKCWPAECSGRRTSSPTGTIIQSDGHHLELDDDFAFSLRAAPQEWENERSAMADFDDYLTGTV